MPSTRRVRQGWDGLRLLARQSRALFRAGLSTWTVAALVLVLLTTIPLAAVFVGVLGPSSDTWQHIASTVLADYLLNSAALMVLVGALTLLMGVSAAWLVAMCSFPGRRIFEWGLILPLAIPTYIAGITYAELLAYGSPLYELTASIWPSPTPPNFQTHIMTLPGAAVVLSLVLFPYTYVITRASFAKQSGSILETARILGRSPWQTFFQVALPLARPAVVAGSTLVLMEVLNEYGAVKYYGIPTFTTGIFRAWFPLDDPDAALRLAGCLLLFVFSLILVERGQRGRARFDDGARVQRPAPRYLLRGWRAVAALAVCVIPMAFGFVIPVAQLTAWSVAAAPSLLDWGFASMAMHSFGLALAAAALAVLVALVVAYAARLSPAPLLIVASRLAVLGYSIPGAVIAVGVLVPFVWLDRRIDGLAEAVFGTGTGLLLTGGLAALVFAYVVRFLAVSLSPIESGFRRVCGNLDECSRSLGLSPLRTLLRVDIPLLKGVLASAALLVFVDVLKELPLTLILRPFNFDTLATSAFQLASDERVAQSAVPALLVILTGLIPVILLDRLVGKTGPGHRAEESAVEATVQGLAPVPGESGFGGD
jgi:iron(III) transport system permease protein